MILFGIYLLVSGTGGDKASIQNLWNDGGFFPKGLFNKTETGYSGLFAAMAMIMFSFGGLELIGITAAEAKNPEKTIPQATNQVIYRILIFYVGALVILFALSPWREITEGTSPFVMVFQNLNGFEFNLFGKVIQFNSLIANVLNLIVLTAALSVYNSSIYSNSRMLFGLAQQGNAPKFLTKLNKSHVPTNAIIVSSCFAGICIIINKLVPEKAFEYLMALVVSTLIINWLMICYTHLKFRKEKDKEGMRTSFPSIFYPVSNYICILFLIAILVLMSITGMEIQVILIPVWLAFLFVMFKLYKTKNQ
jgi:aromatic amino acid transport protein AroP